MRNKKFHIALYRAAVPQVFNVLGITAGEALKNLLEYDIDWTDVVQVDVVEVA